ncbi:MAG: DoxX family protein [Myxococcaceae bacterium]|nr:DoxX family protein [Myxococcaceae bacterium]
MTAGADSNGAPMAATVLRLGLGLIFLAHALAKPLVLTMAGTAQFFAHNGIPGWTVYPVLVVELLAGVALILGLGVRWVALGLLPVMLGALKVHGPAGFVFSSPGGGWEYIAFLMVALIAQAFLGNGAFALGDVLVGSRRMATRSAEI